MTTLTRTQKDVLQRMREGARLILYRWPSPLWRQNGKHISNATLKALFNRRVIKGKNYNGIMRYIYLTALGKSIDIGD